MDFTYKGCMLLEFSKETLQIFQKWFSHNFERASKRSDGSNMYYGRLFFERIQFAISVRFSIAQIFSCALALLRICFHFASPHVGNFFTCTWPIFELFERNQHSSSSEISGVDFIQLIIRVGIFSWPSSKEFSWKLGVCFHPSHIYSTSC